MGIGKTGMIVGLLFAVSAASAQITTTSSIVGFRKVDKPAGKLNLVGNSFGDEGSTLNEIIAIGQFNGDAFFSQADRVIVWDEGSDLYATYALYDDTAYGGSTREWRLGNEFSEGAAVNPVIPAGSSFWVQSAGVMIDTNLAVFGSVVSSQSETNQVVAGLQMLAYPFSTSVDLNETQLKDNATGDAFFSGTDRVIAWNVASQTYTTYALYDDTAYGGSTREWQLGNDFGTSVGAINVDLGNGFWYQAQSQFQWVETNKYFNSL